MLRNESRQIRFAVGLAVLVAFAFAFWYHWLWGMQADDQVGIQRAMVERSRPSQH